MRNRPASWRARARASGVGLYVLGAKSYGRAPTFLLATGSEQVRSVVAEIAGDTAAAKAVHLELPEKGVCSSAPPPVPTLDASCDEPEQGTARVATISGSCC